MFWEITLNGKHLLHCYSKHKKIDFGKLFFAVNEITNSWADFSPHKLIFKEIKPKEDNTFDWVDISA